MGKGNFKLVPVLIPKDCQNALNILADPSRRKEIGISSSLNKYLFATTQGSDSHASG